MEHHEKRWEKALYWTPRILGMVLALSLYYLFITEAMFPKFSLVRLVLGLIPGTVLVLIYLVAWKVELVGGIVFVVLGAAYSVGAWLNLDRITIFLIGIPLVLTGVLFLIHDMIRWKEHHENGVPLPPPGHRRKH